MCHNHSVDNDPTTEAQVYYEDVAGLHTTFEDQRSKIKQKQEALATLDQRISKIDCDIGGASITIDGMDSIAVRITTPNLPPEVKSILHDYQWPKLFKTSYDTRARCLIWELETDIDHLIQDHQRKTAGE